MYKLIDLVFIFDLVKNILLCINDVEILNYISLNLSYCTWDFYTGHIKSVFELSFGILSHTLELFFQVFLTTYIDIIIKTRQEFFGGFPERLWWYPLVLPAKSLPNGKFIFYHAVHQWNLYLWVQELQQTCLILHKIIICMS